MNYVEHREINPRSMNRALKARYDHKFVLEITKKACYGMLVTFTYGYKLRTAHRVFHKTDKMISAVLFRSTDRNAPYQCFFLPPASAELQNKLFLV